MTPKATFTSNLPQFERDLADAIDSGLIFTAEQYAEDVKARLRQGYTTGAFTPDVDLRFPGTVADSVVVGTPVTEKGVRLIRAGTTSPLGAMWEFGHRNEFTNRFERVQVWKNTAIQAAHQMGQTFRRVVRSRMSKWTARSSGGRAA